MFKKFVSISLMLLLSNVVTSANTDVGVLVPEKGINDILYLPGYFPIPEAYGDIENSPDDRQRYIDDVNWYLYRTYVQTKLINAYGITKGWKPPDAPPICLSPIYVPFKSLNDFESKALGNNIAFQWEMVEYIRYIKTSYSDLVERLHVDYSNSCVY